MTESAKKKQKKPEPQQEIKSEVNCPDCGAPLQHGEGCVMCPFCGWSHCG